MKIRLLKRFFQSPRGLITRQRGQTIIEVLIAVGVGSLVLTAIAATAVIAVSNSNFAKSKTEALKYLQEGVENVRIARDNALSWDNFTSSNLGSSEETLPGDVYTRTTEVAWTSPPDTDKVTVTVTVTWQGGGGTNEVTTTTLLGQWAQ